jgi:hypothetical protein
MLHVRRMYMSHKQCDKARIILPALPAPYTLGPVAPDFNGILFAYLAPSLIETTALPLLFQDLVAFSETSLASTEEVGLSSCICFFERFVRWRGG